MPGAVARGWFKLCLLLGRGLRGSRYSTTRVVRRDGVPEVRKHRRFYAPVLVVLGNLLMKVLGTGVRILPQRKWEENERLLYRTLHRESIRTQPGGTLVLPCLEGMTLAAMLEAPGLADSRRKVALGLAAAALADLHARGITHGDAMAENVMVDVEGGVARWFDFETVHGPDRSPAWRRADDLRSLIATCLLRTPTARFQPTVQLLLGAYRDDTITPLVAESFAVGVRRQLVFQLAQAGLSFEDYRKIGRLLKDPWGESR